MSTFTERRAANPANVRKILDFAIFVKPWEDDDEEIKSIHGPDGLVIPDGYQSLGLISKDGETWNRDQQVADVTSHGFSEPVRRDITSDQSGLQFTAQESKLQNIELYHGVDLSGLEIDADGNFVWDKPSRPAPKDLRVLAIGKDGADADAVYLARWLPRAQVTEVGSQTWSEDNELVYQMTLSAYMDVAVGTAMREIWAGPGFKAEDFGLTVV